MEQTLTKFIAALREAQVPVSIGESIDALKTTDFLGFGDRQLLKDSLGMVVAKSEDEKATYSHLFDLYFSRTRAESANYEESDGPSDEQSSGDEAGDGEEQDSPSLLEMLEAGDGMGLSMAMERAANELETQRIRYSTQIGYFTRQMLERMGLRDLEGEVIANRREDTDESNARADEINEMRAELLAKGREFMERQFEIYGEAATENFREEYLSKTRLTDLDRHDMERMKRIVQRMAKRLASKHSRRRKKKNRGQLDIRKTMRANAAFDGIPFETHWKQKKRERAKVVCICDVSQSVAAYAKFLLMLIYNLAEVIPSISSYAFAHKLIDVGDTLEDFEIDEAIAKVLKDVGMGSTDYGQAFMDFESDFSDIIDRHTTVIVLGDGRSNYGDPRIDIFRNLSTQSKRMIWLCTEQTSLWGSGDSEMLRFAPFCHIIRPCSTVKDLERVVDDLLKAYE